METYFRVAPRFQTPLRWNYCHYQWLTHIRDATHSETTPQHTTTYYNTLCLSYLLDPLQITWAHFSWWVLFFCFFWGSEPPSPPRSYRHGQYWPELPAGSTSNSMRPQKLRSLIRGVIQECVRVCKFTRIDLRFTGIESNRSSLGCGRF